MKSLIFGFFGLLVVLYLSLDGEIDTYIQMHSIVIVIGGTITLAFFTTPGNVIPRVFKAVRMMAKKEELFNDYSQELEQLAKTRKIPHESKNPLIKYAVELWEQGIDANLFIALIAQKRMEIENETIDAVQALKNLAKYPPALGMTGTVMGMIALFASLDTGSADVGANLALAMTATFFGLIVTNLFISPVADRLQVRHVNRKRLYQNVYQILLLINQGEPVQLVTGEVDERAA